MLECIEETPMRPEEWEEVKRIFDSAVKLSLAERGGFVAAACAHNPGLLQAVDELLQANDEAYGFLEEESAGRPLPPVFETGQLVAERFRIIRLISRGGMGEVYETFDERLSVRLALKTLRPEFARDLDSLERFRREIRVTREISHPNLCRVYELVEHRVPEDPADSGRIVTCLTMQLMAGETLQQYLANAGRLSPNAALPFIEQMAGAIGVLHENGIVHRDLKPSNVMITPSAGGDLRAIVMDFGLAKPFNGEKEVFNSRRDFNAGAPFFLAPELVRGERPSIASDIYAFGLIVDEMVTGGGAFSGETVESILYQKLWSDPNDPLTRAPDLPANWCQTIRRCLHRNPAKRPSSAAQVVRELSASPAETQRVPPLYCVIGKMDGFVRNIYRRHPAGLRLFLIACAALSIGGGAFIGILGSRPLNTSVVTFEFENMTGKPENDYLSKGITREVERRLLQIPGVSVVPFHGVRPKDAVLKTESRFSLDGQLQSNKAATRLSVEVIDNTTRALICCSNAFENNMADALEMQSAIASAVVDAMRDSVLLPDAQGAGGFPGGAVFGLLHRVPLTGAQQALAPPTTSSAAMQFYMRGHSLAEQSTLASLKQARELYREAIKADGNFALAYADLAIVEWTLLQFNAFPRAQLLQLANAHAQQAVEKGPAFAESYAALAIARQYSWDLRGAEQTYKRAIELNPKLANPHREYGGLLIQLGRFDEGLKEVRTSIVLDPYNPDRQFLGTYLHYAGRAEEAIAFLRQINSEKDSEQAHQILGYAYAGLAVRDVSHRADLLTQALREADIVAKAEGPTQKPNYTGRATPMYALFYALEGNRRKAQRYLDLLLEGEKEDVVDDEDIVTIYTALGDLKKAQRFLDRDWEKRDTSLCFIKVNPFLEPLRSTTAFQALIARTGL